MMRKIVAMLALRRRFVVKKPAKQRSNKIEKILLVSIWVSSSWDLPLLFISRETVEKV
jgi:hypothetical protein